MMPQVLSPNHERGYYIVWDTVNWRKERVVSFRTFFVLFLFFYAAGYIFANDFFSQREFTLHYADLDPAPQPVAP